MRRPQRQHVSALYRKAVKLQWQLWENADPSLLTEKSITDRIPKPVDAIDTLGAGDSFTTAFLLSLLDGEKIETAMEKGAEFAAKTCMVRALLDTAFRLRIRSLVTACKILGSNRNLLWKGNCPCYLSELLLE